MVFIPATMIIDCDGAHPQVNCTCCTLCCMAASLDDIICSLLYLGLMLDKLDDINYTFM